MGLHNRKYMKDDQGGHGGYRDEGGFVTRGTGKLSKPTRAVTVLLIANVVIFLLQLVPGVTEKLVLVSGRWWYVWNYITFQFAHFHPWHLIGNMFGLYILGVILEKEWGPRRFVTFYFACGVFAGICHILLTFLVVGSLQSSLLGASGGVFGILVACAILYPNIRLIMVFFLVPIRVVAIVFLCVAAYFMLPGSRQDGVSHAAHLGGAVMGAFWVWVLPRFQIAAGEANLKRKQGAWDRKMKQRASEQAEIDRILDKIKLDGLNSLSRSEKHTLQQATKRQQADEDRAHRL